MNHRLFVTLLFTTVVGCTGSAQMQYSAEADVSPPPLVEVSPGVQVIADYDQPVFYSDNVYWRYDAGVWYRSPSHTTGWVRVEAVPPQIRRIDRPTAYVHYRADAHAEVRDHREPVAAPPPPPPAPEVRDHRGPPPAVVEHREEHREERHENEEHREERHDEHNEDKKKKHKEHEGHDHD